MNAVRRIYLYAVAADHTETSQEVEDRTVEDRAVIGPDGLGGGVGERGRRRTRL